MEPSVALFGFIVIVLSANLPFYICRSKLVTAVLIRGNTSKPFVIKTYQQHIRLLCAKKKNGWLKKTISSPRLINKCHIKPPFGNMNCPVFEGRKYTARINVLKLHKQVNDIVLFIYYISFTCMCLN